MSNTQSTLNPGGAGVQPPAPPPPQPPSPEVSPWRKALAALVKSIHLVGPPLAILIEHPQLGPLVLRWLALLLALLVLYPLLVVLSVSWTLQLKVLPDEARVAYANTVRRAFRVEESARKISDSDNQRLDYFQSFEFREAAVMPQSISFMTKPYQLVVLRAHRTDLVTADSVACPLPVRRMAGANLFVLSAGNIEIAKLRHGVAEQVVRLDADFWKRVANKLVPDQLQLTLEPSELTKELDCHALMANVRLSVEVFKGFVEGAPVTPN